jgi:hypothetical protein
MLFKFATGTLAAENLLNGKFRFTEPIKLNDPSEMLRQIQDQLVADSLEKLVKTGHTDEQFRWLGCQFHILKKLSPETLVIGLPLDKSDANELLKLAVYADSVYLNGMLQITLQLMRQRTGILSLCESYYSLPMWAHYAANGNGYVVEYEGMDELFKGDHTGSLNMLTKVSYHDVPPGLSFDPSSQNNVFFCKFQDWSYEREWRVVKALADCEQSASGLFLFESGIQATSLTAGWNMSEIEFTQIRNYASPSTKFFRAKINIDGKVIREQADY